MTNVAVHPLSLWATLRSHGGIFFRYQVGERPLEECRLVRAGAPAIQHGCKIVTVNDAITVDIAAWIRTATRPPIHEERCEIHGVNGPCLVNIRVANQHARLALLTTVGNIVGIVVEQ